MGLKLCEWCGEPATTDSDLCSKCLAAQAQVEAGELIPAKPQLPARRFALLPAVGALLVLVGKSLLALAAGTIMLAAALFGTCSVIVAVISVTNPFSAMFFLFLAGLGFGVTFLLYRLIKRMYEAPLRRIDQDPPPAIEQKD